MSRGGELRIIQSGRLNVYLASIGAMLLIRSSCLSNSREVEGDVVVEPDHASGATPCLDAFDGEDETAAGRCR